MDVGCSDPAAPCDVFCGNSYCNKDKIMVTYIALDCTIITLIYLSPCKCERSSMQMQSEVFLCVCFMYSP